MTVMPVIEEIPHKLTVNTPTHLADDVTAISAGWWFTMFLKNDSTLWATGWNCNSELDDRTTSRPVHIADDVTKISAGCTHSLLLKKDGSLWTTGSNGFGQRGHLNI